MSNKTNKQLYTSFLAGFIKDECKLPEAAALAKLIEHCIKEKTYKIYNVEDTENYNEYDIIVTFNFAGDPRFGLYRYKFDDHKLVVSTPKGLTCYDL